MQIGFYTALYTTLNFHFITFTFLYYWQRHCFTSRSSILPLNHLWYAALSLYQMFVSVHWSYSSETIFQLQWVKLHQFRWCAPHSKHIFNQPLLCRTNRRIRAVLPLWNGNVSERVVGTVITFKALSRLSLVVHLHRMLLGWLDTDWTISPTPPSTTSNNTYSTIQYIR